MDSEAGQNSTEYEGVFHFDAADPIYETHFPQYPVVPGSLIIQAFLQALQENGIACQGLRIENFSFREFLPPGVCRFSIARRGGILECRITKDGKKIASGILSYET
ncbi:MAG: hypothetical protein ABFD62_14620 [Syntrophaceae bacterium]|jgi:3-hydroxyacyl-[acyl-carrier-protein] dehydratase